MKFDRAYFVWLNDANPTEDVTAEDVRRVMSLPRPVNLALPFLFSARELEMHRLLVKFYHGQPEDFYLGADRSSQGLPLVAAAGLLAKDLPKNPFADEDASFGAAAFEDAPLSAGADVLFGNEDELEVRAALFAHFAHFPSFSCAGRGRGSLELGTHLGDTTSHAAESSFRSIFNFYYVGDSPPPP